MKILVCISSVPETTAPVKFTDDGSAFDSNGVNFIINPYDEWFALTRSIELVERSGGEVVVINVGKEANNSLVQKALAVGADKAVRVDVDPEDSRQVAQEIASYAKGQDFDLIVTGKETIDHSSGLVGGMIAAILDWHFESFVSHLEIEGNKAILHRDIEGGHVRASIPLPLVVSASKGMGEQRIPNMRGIMMAKKKPNEVRLAEYSNTNTVTRSFSVTPSKSGVTMIDPDNMDELVRLLKEEAKVI